MTRADALIAILCLAWLTGLATIVDPTITIPAGAANAAEWASAIATLLAVVAALGIALTSSRQLNRIEKDRRREVKHREVKKFLIHLTHLAAIAEVLRLEVLKPEWDPVGAAMSLGEYKAALEDLRSVAPADLPTLHFARIYTQTIGAATGISHLMTWAVENPENGPPPPNYLDLAKARLDLRYEELTSKLADQQIEWR